jgi:hypothetical protein
MTSRHNFHVITFTTQISHLLSSRSHVAIGRSRFLSQLINSPCWASVYSVSHVHVSFRGPLATPFPLHHHPVLSMMCLLCNDCHDSARRLNYKHRRTNEWNHNYYNVQREDDHTAGEMENWDFNYTVTHALMDSIVSRLLYKAYP